MSKFCPYQLCQKLHLAKLQRLLSEICHAVLTWTLCDLRTNDVGILFKKYMPVVNHHQIP